LARATLRWSSSFQMSRLFFGRHQFK
jgi:hypothetical protein